MLSPSVPDQSIDAWHHQKVELMVERGRGHASATHHYHQAREAARIPVDSIDSLVLKATG